MARSKLELNKVDLQRVITELESKQTFVNPSALFKAVEETEWAKTMQPRPLTAAVVYARVKELGIIYKTQPGKRGGSGAGLAAARASGAVRVPRSKKMEAFADSFAKMRASYPKRFLPLIDKAEKGSARACMKLKCLECSAFDIKEIKLCNIDTCGLYPIRPYQGKVGQAEDETETDEAEE